MQAALRTIVRQAAPAARNLSFTALARGGGHGAAPHSALGDAIDKMTTSGYSAHKIAHELEKTQNIAVTVDDVIRFTKARDPEYTWWSQEGSNTWYYAPVPGSVRHQLPFLSLFLFAYLSRLCLSRTVLSTLLAWV